MNESHNDSVCEFYHYFNFYAAFAPKTFFNAGIHLSASNPTGVTTRLWSLEDRLGFKKVHKRERWRGNFQSAPECQPNLPTTEIKYELLFEFIAKNLF